VAVTAVTKTTEITTVSAEQRPAHEMLNRSPRSGCTNTQLVAHGFTLAVLVSLVCDRLVEVETKTVTAPGRSTQIVRFRITVAGRRAIGD
jgi:hypothetical protein